MTIRPLKRHQQKAIVLAKKAWRSVRKLQFGLFMAPGVGKTIIAIRLAKRLPAPRLVLCRRDDFLTWKNELVAEGVPVERILFVESGKDSSLPGDDYDWVCITYDLVKNPDIKREIKSTAYSIAIADEVHMLKRFKSKRTKAVIRSTRHIPNRLGMTGTNITNDPKDVFSQVLFLDNGRTFGDSEFWFMKRYFFKVDFAWYPKKGLKDLIADKLKTIAVHVHEDDVLSLPPVREYTKSAPLSGMQRRHYEKMLDSWEYDVGGETAEIDQVIVQLMKLRQIAGGFMYQEDGTPVLFKCPKLEQLFADLKDPDVFGDKPKIIIWCSHTAEINRICARAHEEDITHIKFIGSMKTPERVAARERFRDNKYARLFVGQVDAGVGMNELVVADTAIYYSNSLKVVSRQQSMRRNRRIGSEHHAAITYVDYVSEGTIDEALVKSIKSDMNFAQSILNKVKRGISLRNAISLR